MNNGVVKYGEDSKLFRIINSGKDYDGFQRNLIMQGELVA